MCFIRTYAQYYHSKYKNISYGQYQQHFLIMLYAIKFSFTLSNICSQTKIN